ncbi:unnamed protein product [Caretta caretta]
MCGRKVNAEIELWTRAPLHGLKHGWDGSRLPSIHYHQASALDTVDPGGGGCRIDGLASLHPCQVAWVLDHEEHVVGILRQDQPQLWLPQHQPRQPPTEETEQGLDLQSIQLAREEAPLLYSSPEADLFRQGPVEPNQTFCRGIQHPEKTHKLGSKAKCSESAQEIPMIHPVECLLLIQGQEGEQQTIPTPELQEVPDQIQVVKDGAARDGLGLVWVAHVRKHGPYLQGDGFCYDFVVRAEERDGMPIW